jgi:hypothetical protein
MSAARKMSRPSNQDAGSEPSGRLFVESAPITPAKMIDTTSSSLPSATLALAWDETDERDEHDREEKQHSLKRALGQPGHLDDALDVD